MLSVGMLLFCEPWAEGTSKSIATTKIILRRNANLNLLAEVQTAPQQFALNPSIRGTLVWGPYNKDAYYSGYYIRVPYFRKPPSFPGRILAAACIRHFPLRDLQFQQSGVYNDHT